MIVALLVLIVLILLFGAGVVKGWIANLATMGCGFIAICLALAWLGSFFGENGFMYVLFALGGIMLLLAVVAHILNSETPAAPTPRAPAPAHQSSATASAAPPAGPSAVDRVWGWYAHDITLRFSAEARGKAWQLYDAGDAHGLDRLCREEMSRLR